MALPLTILHYKNIGDYQLGIIANLNLETQILAIDNRGFGKVPSAYLALDKSKITFLNQFLRIFGAGELAQIDYSLNNVAYRLHNRNWNEAAIQPIDSNEYKAFLNVSRIVNKSGLPLGGIVNHFPAG